MKTPAILATALALQLVLALGLVWNGLSDTVTETRALLDFDIADVDRLVVDDNLGTAVVARSDDGWVLPELHGLPGAGGRVDRLLADLAALETGYPVATTASAQERFEVAEDRFQRHVQFFDGDELIGELYLGTAPGLRQAHTRRAGEDEIYNLPISSFEFGGDDNDWMDKSLLAASDVTRVEAEDFTLEKQGDAWTLAAIADGETLAQSPAAEIATALRGLRVLRVADSVPEELDWREYSVQSGKRHYCYRLARSEERRVGKKEDAMR